MKLKTEICNSFNAHAAQYEQVAIAQKEIGERLIERLDYLKIQPRYVLDLGCGSGFFSQQLKKRYPNTHIVGLDLAHTMLVQAKKRQPWLQKWSLVHTDMMSMPFPSGLFDLVFANQVIHWASPMANVMREINRVMHKDACFMFSTLGPDTFYELRSAWALADRYAHINDYIDMHDLGDILLAEHFADPVVDMEMLTVHYATLSKLLHALKAQGVRNINSARNSGLTGKQTWRKFEAAMQTFCTDQGQFPLTYEVVYGHAWKSGVHRVGQGTETFISVEQLRSTLG